MVININKLIIKKEDTFMIQPIDTTPSLQTIRNFTPLERDSRIIE